MIAGSKEVNAEFKEVPGNFLGKPEAAGGILSVGNHQVDHVTVDEPVQLPGNCLTARFSDDIAYKQQLNGHTQSPWSRESRSP